MVRPRMLVLTLILCAGLLWAGGAAPGWAAEEPSADMTWGSVKDGLAVRGLTCLRVHPKDPNTLFAHVLGIGPAVSKDGGRVWKPMVVSPDAKPGLMDFSRTRITVDPREPRIVYVTIDGHVYRSDDGGTKFKDITSGALASLSWDKLKTAHLVWEVRVDSKKSALLLAGTKSDGRHHGGLFESQDGGKSWQLIAGSTKPTSGLSHDAFWIRRDPRTEKNITVAGATGVWYSDDRGRTFRLNLPGFKGVRALDVHDVADFVGGARDLYLADARGLWHSKDGGKGWSKKPLRRGDFVRIVLDPNSRKRMYAILRDRGLFLSEDSKRAKWEPLGGKFGESENTAYADAELRDIVVHPRTKHVVFATSPITGLHRSDDDGTTFKPVEPGDVPGKSAGAAPGQMKKWEWPEVVARIAAVGRHPGGDKGHLAISREGVVYRSSDGMQWTREGAGRLGMVPHGLRPDPRMPNAWFAWGRRLLRSEDGGATWDSIWEDPSGDESIADFQAGVGGQMHILLSRSGRVMRWAPPKKPGVSILSNWDGAKDGPLDEQATATSLALDTDNPDHWVICARSVHDAWIPKDTGAGVFETWNAGKKWTSLNEGLGLPRKPTAADRQAREYWNRGRFVHYDAKSKLITYAADWRGILVRQSLDPKADAVTKKTAWLEWVDITPPESLTSGRAAISAFVHGPDGEIRAQLRSATNATALVGINGKTIADMWGAAHKAATEKKDKKKDADDKDKAPPASWATLKDPGVVLTSLSIDPENKHRLLGSDAIGQSGVLLFQAPVDESEDDTDKGDPGKGDPGKGDPGKGDPGKGDPGKGDPGKGDPGKGDPGKGDPGKGDPGKGDPGKGDPGKGDPGKGDPGKGDGAKPEGPQPDGTKPEEKGGDDKAPTGTEPKQDDGAKPAEPAKPDAPEAEDPKSGEPKKDDAKPEDPKPEDPKPDEPKPDEPKPDEPKPDEPKKDDPKPDEPKKDDPPKQDPPAPADK